MPCSAQRVRARAKNATWLQLSRRRGSLSTRSGCGHRRRSARSRIRPGLLVGPGSGHLAAVGTPAAAVGDAADLLDVHVDQLARTVAFIANRGGLRGADHLAGHRVTGREAADAVT